jgi:hypothetical protein
VSLTWPRPGGPRWGRPRIVTEARLRPSLHWPERRGGRLAFFRVPEVRMGRFRKTNKPQVPRLPLPSRYYGGAVSLSWPQVGSSRLAESLSYSKVLTGSQLDSDLHRPIAAFKLFGTRPACMTCAPCPDIRWLQPALRFKSPSRMRTVSAVHSARS